jgi:small subunit ribosomal protein S1
MAENNTEAQKVAINDIGTEEDFIKAVDSTIKNFDDGDLVEGTVVKVDHDEVLLDIGYKTEGVIPSRELSIKKDVDPDEVVQVGDSIEALVVTKEDKEGRLILSKKRAQYERAWGDIEKIKDADGVVEGTVIEAVKGGLIVDIGLRGFLPASLVEMRRVRDLSPYIGQKIKAKILELDKNRNNVVLSRRQYLEETQSEVRETFLSQLKKGQIREGVVSLPSSTSAHSSILVRVRRLHPRFRAFLEAHRSPESEVVKVGDKVTVEVLRCRSWIASVSHCQSEGNPGRSVAAFRTYPRSQDRLSRARLPRLCSSVCFISVEDGIEGLVHISELANRHVENPETVVKPNEEDLRQGHRRRS